MRSNPAVNDLAGKATLIGSFPLTDHREAVKLILEYTPEVPCWPQLPALGEGMLLQFSSGLPGFDPKTLRLDPGAPEFEEERLRFYEEYLGVTEGGLPVAETRFGLRAEEVPGLYALLEAFSGRTPPAAVKGQITGPFTLATGLKTPDGRAVFYEPELRDLVVKLVALKARAQVEALKTASSTVLLFLDEPALSGFGSSAFVGVSAEEVRAALEEVIAEVHRAGAVAGIHVCGNTDWALVLGLSVEVVNFDAFDFAETFLAYSRELREFLSRGGLVAWGLVPTLNPETLARTGPEELSERLDLLLEKLSTTSGFSVKDIKAKSMITPACGMGTLSPELAVRALDLLRSLREHL